MNKGQVGNGGSGRLMGHTDYDSGVVRYRQLLSRPPVEVAKPQRDAGRTIRGLRQWKSAASVTADRKWRTNTRVWVGVVACLALCACIAILGASKPYAVYYDCSEGRETVLTIMNADAMNAEYTLSLFSPIGRKIGEASGVITPYVSITHALNELLASGWEAEACGPPDRPKNKGQLALCRGGLALIESTASLLVKVSLVDSGGSAVAANVDQVVPAGREHTSYWYATSYVNTSTQRTRLSIVNPYDERTCATFSLHDEAGNLRNMVRLYPMGYEASTYDIGDYFEEGAAARGVIDIFSSFPIVVFVEYIDEEGALQSIEQTSHCHFFLD